MSLHFHLGIRVLSLALFFQGLFIYGVFNNQAIISTMLSSIEDLQSQLQIKSLVLEIMKNQISNISKAIGLLFILAGYNILKPSRLVFKANILGLIFLTLFVGIPWRVIKKEATPLDLNDKNLFHLYMNLAMIGGIVYWLFSTKVHRVVLRRPMRDKKAV